MKADAIFQRGLELFKSADAPEGLVTARRTVCKAEWAYEVELVFKGDKFKDYMESEFREQKAAPGMFLFFTCCLVQVVVVYVGTRVLVLSTCFSLYCTRVLYGTHTYIVRMFDWACLSYSRPSSVVYVCIVPMLSCE